jgi:DNA mismatch repair ATPase MutS
MRFYSILFPERDKTCVEEIAEAPECFPDLHLDQIVESITSKWTEYDLAPFFHAPLRALDQVVYRQEVMYDLQQPGVLQSIKSFSQQMGEVRDRLKNADKLYYKYAIERSFLGTVGIYCAAVQSLSRNLASCDVQSRGLGLLSECLEEYIDTAAFRARLDEAERLKADLANIRYCVLIKGDSVAVRDYGDESDYSVIVEETFRKFRSGDAATHRLKIPKWEGMNHIEAEILDRVALLFPHVFRTLDEFCTKHAEFIDETVVRFDREIQFYVAYLSHVEKFRRSNLKFCIPALSESSKEICGHDAFDLALAERLIGDQSAVVCNDFFLRDPERIFVVSGPNQGGKTTFARMIGQLHYLARLGCPIPGTEGRLLLCDHVFAHFERQEDIANLRGKLQDDLVRIRSILDEATPKSIIILNEIFSSTTVQDALFLGTEIIKRITALDALCVCVTFLDELASLNEKTVSIVSMVEPQNPALRTFRLERRPADGLAYALAIAEKHRVTYSWLKERLRL